MPSLASSSRLPVCPPTDVSARWIEKRYAGLVIILLVLFAGLFQNFGDPGAGMDEGMVLLYPELMQHGMVPYRDFETFYGPGNLWFLQLVYSMFGAGIYVERTIGLLYRLAILLCIYGITQRRGQIAGLGSMFIAGVFLLGTELFAIAWVGALAAALAAFWLLVWTPRRTFAASARRDRVIISTRPGSRNVGGKPAIAIANVSKRARQIHFWRLLSAGADGHSRGDRGCIKSN